MNWAVQNREHWKVFDLVVQQETGGKAGKIQDTCLGMPVHLKYLTVFQTPVMSAKHNYFDKSGKIELKILVCFCYYFLIPKFEQDYQIYTHPGIQP